MKLKEAIKKTLRENRGRALSTSEIWEYIQNHDLWQAKTATPEATVGSHLTERKTGLVATGVVVRHDTRPQTYSMATDDSIDAGVSSEASVLGDLVEQEGGNGNGKSLIRAFGMFWHRNRISFEPKGGMWGEQGRGGNVQPVDFSEQYGVYILYDGHRPVYVGKSERGDGIYARLRSHTKDPRKAGRWDRFSWFGIRGVTDRGELEEMNTEISPELLVSTMEALMIEAIEPPLNRVSGNHIGGSEYLQALDPALKEEQDRDAFLRMAEQLFGR